MAVMVRRPAALVAVLLLLPALAGCAGDAPGAREEPVQKGTTGSQPNAPLSDGTPAPAVKPKGTSERWHFHDYWKGNPTITLVEANVSFNVTTGADGLPALSAFVDLPQGVIVPPETGILTLNVTWEAETQGLVNVTFRPADSNDFLPGLDLAKGVPGNLTTTESQADVPHRQVSAWRFNLTMKPSPDVAGLPPRDVHFTVQATIGRPLFIDPPHLNWWQGGDILPLVADAKGEFASLAHPGGNLTLADPLQAPAAPPTAAKVAESPRVPVAEGRIVPEGTKSIVAILNWTTQAPQGKLALHYRENNYPSEGALEVATDAAGSRVFVLPVMAAQTDTTYSNRTTWEFRIVPEGQPASAFEGAYTLHAWATRLAPADAVAAIAPKS